MAQLKNRIYKGLLLSSLTVLFTSFNLSALAKTVVYRGEAAIQLQHSQDEIIGNYIAKQVAQLRVLQKAEPFIFKQDFAKNMTFPPSEKYALSLNLANDFIVYPSSTAQTPVFKTKITYNTLDLPQNYLSYRMSNFGELLVLTYAYTYHQDLTREAIAYLNQINQTSDKNAAQLLRITQGKSLFEKIQAEELSDEANILDKKGRYKEALEKIEKSIQKSPHYIGYTVSKIGILVQQYKQDKVKSKLDQAIALSTALIEKYPGDSFIYFLRAVLYMYQDVVPEQGIQDLQKAISLGKKREHPMYYTLLAIAAHKSGHKRLSEKSYQKACELGFKKACGSNIELEMTVK